MNACDPVIWRDTQSSTLNIAIISFCHTLILRSIIYTLIMHSDIPVFYHNILILILHSAILSFSVLSYPHSAILSFFILSHPDSHSSFCHTLILCSIIPSFCHTLIPIYHHSSILSCFILSYPFILILHSVIFHSITPSFSHTLIPHSVVPSFSHSVILTCRVSYSAIIRGRLSFLL